MRSQRWLLSALIALFALGALACGGGSHTTKAGLIANDRPGGSYLALGDSFAAGTGASDAPTASYVALIDQALRVRLGNGPQLTWLAVGGHTTQDLIDKQLPQALEAVRGGDVRLVTVTIGGNDLYQYSASPACLDDPARADCPLTAGLVHVEANLDTILGGLRAAGPDVTIVIEDYPNLFSGSGDQLEKQATTAFGLLDDLIDRVAKAHGVLVADPRAAFQGRSLELTHIHDPSPDFHPNDAGHRLIADAFLKVLGLSSAD